MKENKKHAERDIRIILPPDKYPKTEAEKQKLIKVIETILADNEDD